MSKNTKNVFVLGLNDFNRERLASIRRSDTFVFHPLLDVDDLKDAEEYHFQDLLDEAERTLSAFEGSVDAIINFWDFPASLLHPILCKKFQVPGPPLEAVALCGHKYWSRLAQREAIPEFVPEFEAFDPFDEASVKGVSLEYPFWIKPVQSYSSFLAFQIDNEGDLLARTAEIREQIDRYAEPFAEVWDRLSPPKGAQHVDARWCIAEAPLTGHQCTIEGYVLDGKAETYGVIDSYRFPNGVSFHRYQYPSSLPEDVVKRMSEASCRVMEHIGYEKAAFNIEWFWEKETDFLRLLEINNRISQSHADLFAKVDGRSNHEVVVELARGNPPSLRDDKGPFAMAAKVFIRRFEDGVVEKVPSRDEVQAVERDFPGTTLQVPVTEGMRLSEILDQDSYSYQLAILYTGGKDEEEILEKARRIEDRLDFKVRPLTSPAAIEG